MGGIGKHIATALLVLLVVGACGDESQPDPLWAHLSGTYTPDVRRRFAAMEERPSQDYAASLATYEALLKERAEAPPLQVPASRSAREALTAVEEMLKGLGEDGAPPRQPGLGTLSDPFLFDVALTPAGTFVVTPSCEESLIHEARGSWRLEDDFVELTYDDIPGGRDREWLPTRLQVRGDTLVFQEAPISPLVLSRPVAEELR